MTSRIALFLLPLALAACGDGASKSSAPAAPVAAVTAPAGQSWLDTVSQTDGGFRVGNPNASIKLVEYGARSCPTCGAFAREGAEPLLNNYVATGKVSFEFRDFLVHGASDIPGALLGACAGPGPFFPLMEAMYNEQNAYLDKLQAMSPADQKAMESMTPTQVATTLAEKGGLLDLVKTRGIPEQKARACLGDQKALEALAKRTEKWGQDGTVTGTPTFYINGEKYGGAPSWEGLEAALKTAGA